MITKVKFKKKIIILLKNKKIKFFQQLLKISIFTFKTFLIFNIPINANCVLAIQLIRYRYYYTGLLILGIILDTS